MTNISMTNTAETVTITSDCGVCKGRGGIFPIAIATDSNLSKGTAKSRKTANHNLVCIAHNGPLGRSFGFVPIPA